MKSRVKTWLTAVRPFAYSASVVPVVLGTGIAYLEGVFDLVLFILALLASVLLHTGTNLVNDSFDFIKGVDTQTSYGSSGMITGGKLTPRQVHRTGILCFFLATVIGFYLVIEIGITIMILGIAGILGGYFYTAKPVQYKYHALGDFLVFFLMGPLMVWGAYYVQTMAYRLYPLVFSLPVGFLVAAILVANNIRDIQHDSKVGIKTVSTLLGFEHSKWEYLLLVSGSFVVILILVLSRLASPFLLLAFLAFPTGYRIMRHVMRTREESAQDLATVDIQSAQLHLQVGGLMIIGLIVSSFLG
ncbi:MAG: 1,4-dihydroxy-2-naphthoate octaprenyltransferase [Proteobacteria bacterium]|nr:1,4-dihydroxy-2-naphthoate octaprenyltransferase [Pseudomonadota bacterium]NIS69652.1 1,4-dihydroxy-2-naphthoate octaprenyltransferase [Pseudomonadota bacterium]